MKEKHWGVRKPEKNNPVHPNVSTFIQKRSAVYGGQGAGRAQREKGGNARLALHPGVRRSPDPIAAGPPAGSSVFPPQTAPPSLVQGDGLKLNIQKTKIMTNGPITSWQIDGGTVETVSGFIFLVSKITADGDCSHEIKRCLLLGRKVMTSLDSILKSRDITLSTKVQLVKAMVFPVVMYGCESWTIKKAEH